MAISANTAWDTEVDLQPCDCIAPGLRRELCVEVYAIIRLNSLFSSCPFMPLRKDQRSYKARRIFCFLLETSWAGADVAGAVQWCTPCVAHQMPLSWASRGHRGGPGREHLAGRWDASGDVLGQAQKPTQLLPSAASGSKAAEGSPGDPPTSRSTRDGDTHGQCPFPVPFPCPVLTPHGVTTNLGAPATP